MSFTKNDYKLLDREVLYSGVFKLARYHLRHRLYQGGESPVFSREVLERTKAAAILPYDPKQDKVILIEQFRPGPVTVPDQNPWLIEIVAGILDSNEQPHEVAIREAQEEAGCAILNIHPICEYFVSPGGSNEYVHLYCGQIAIKDNGGIYGLIEEHEDIRAFTLNTDEALTWVKEGKINTSPAIVSLMWLSLNRNYLKTLWQAT
jgi:ADP-ribose pyrophosphatase